MKLIINGKLTTDNVTLTDLDELDFHQNISLTESDSAFLHWIVAESSAEIQFGSEDRKPQSAAVNDLHDGFDTQVLTTAFKSFFVQDQQWLKQFQWSSSGKSPAPSEAAAGNPDETTGQATTLEAPQLSSDEEEWQSWDVMIDDQTPAVIICNTSISDLIEAITDQFVMFALKLQSPDDNGLATDSEQKFCEAIESEITTFVGNHKGAAVGEITSAGVRQFYTYNEATESDLEKFLIRIEDEFSCSLNCEIEQDPDKFRYWSDLHPEEHMEEDDFADEVDD